MQNAENLNILNAARGNIRRQRAEDSGQESNLDTDEEVVAESSRVLQLLREAYRNGKDEVTEQEKLNAYYQGKQEVYWESQADQEGAFNQGYEEGHRAGVVEILKELLEGQTPEEFLEEQRRKAEEKHQKELAEALAEPEENWD